MPINVSKKYGPGYTTHQIIVDYTTTPYSQIAKSRNTGPLGQNSVQYIINQINQAYANPPYNNTSSIVDGLDYYPLQKTQIKPKNAHQYRVPNSSLSSANKVLSSHPIYVTNYTSFDLLFDAVYNLLKSNNIIKHHCLLVYDIALRLVYQQNQLSLLNTMQNVYLFRGAKEGAKILLKLKRLQYRVPISFFNGIFPNTSAVDIENILCIFF